MRVSRRMYSILLLVILGEASAWTAPPSSRQYHIQTDEGPERYFRYQTDSGQYRKERRLADGTVVGSEGWVDASGYLRLKDYIADDGGYRILKSKTVFVGKGRPIDEAIKSAKSAPAQSGVLAGTRGSSFSSVSPTPHSAGGYIPPSPTTVYLPSSPTPHPPTVYIPSSTPQPPTVYIPSSPSPQPPVYITPRPQVGTSLQPHYDTGYHAPSADFLPPLGPSSDHHPHSVAPLVPTLSYVPPSREYVPPKVVPLGQTGSTPRPFQTHPDTFYVPSSVRPITGFVSSSANPVRVLTPSTAHPIPSYETSTPNYSPSSVLPISGYESSTPSTSYASSTLSPPVSSYASSTVRPPTSSYESSTVSPIASYSPSSSARPSYEDSYKYVSPEPQPFSLKYRDSNLIGDGYQRQYPPSDGVYTTKSGFRYFLPKLYHEEAGSGDERIGSFGYVDPFGIRRVIYYNTAPGTGFRHRHNNRYVGLNGTPYDPRPL